MDVANGRADTIFEKQRVFSVPDGAFKQALGDVVSDDLDGLPAQTVVKLTRTWPGRSESDQALA